MKKLKIFLLIVLVLAVVAGLVLFTLGYIVPKGAGLLIETSPESSVFINGEEIGRTPYKVVRKPGEIVLKLVPDSFEKPLAPYETKITLVSGVETVVRRLFGAVDSDSEGEVVSYEQGVKGKSSIVVVSVPDSAEVSLDGQVKGFTPYRSEDVQAGDHDLSISASGYKPRKIGVRTQNGYRLTVIVKLAPSSEVTIDQKVSPTPSPAEEKVTMVEILSTPTGYLRVRSTPSTLGDEVGRVKPGEKYKLLDEDEKTGWLKIEYMPGKEGWISSQYAKKIGQSAVSVTPSPTPTLKATKTTPTPTAKITPTPSI